MKPILNEQLTRMQKLAGIIPNIIKENMDNWGNETDDYGRNERDYKPKPSLADFNYNKEEYKKYMEEHFPEEPLNEEISEVVGYYLNKLRKFEEDNTADMYDLKNLETAINMYHKELLNKIR